MTYRDDFLAKREAAERIGRELSEVRQRMNDIVALGEREAELEGRFAAACEDAGRARARVTLPLLTNLRIASPCKESWETMTGDSRARHCGRCDKKVFDLSAMDAESAEKLLGDHQLGLCVRFYRRADGTVMTSDCAPGARRKKIRNVAFGVGAAALTVVGGTLGALAFGEETATRDSPPNVMDIRFMNGAHVGEGYVMGEAPRGLQPETRDDMTDVATDVPTTPTVDPKADAG